MLKTEEKNKFGRLKIGAVTSIDPKRMQERKGLPTREEAIEIEKSLRFIDAEANDRFVDLLMATR